MPSVSRQSHARQVVTQSTGITSECRAHVRGVGATDHERDTQQIMLRGVVFTKKEYGATQFQLRLTTRRFI
jgi:hypothetical protein